MIYAFAGADPYLDLGNQTSGVGALGVMALMAVTSIAVVGFFRLRAIGIGGRTSSIRRWPRPGRGCACYLIVDSSLLTGSAPWVVNGLPWLLVVVALVDFVIGAVCPLHAPLDVFDTAPDDPSTAGSRSVEVSLVG